jgi:hypothetical protein
MLKKIFLLFFICCLAHKGTAQNDIIIKSNGDTIQAKIYLPKILGFIDYTLLSKKVNYSILGSETRQKAFPKDIAGFEYKEADSTYKFRSVLFITKGFLSNRQTNYFGRLVEDGAIQCFKIRVSNQRYDDKSKSFRNDRGSLFVYRKRNGEVFKYTYQKKRDLISFMADCPEIVEKIKAGHYNIMFQFKKVISDYNKTCGHNLQNQ